MKGVNTWSYGAYRPFLFDVGHPYICRVAPDESSVYFEWLPEEGGGYMVYYRKRGDGEFALYESTDECFCRIGGLETGADYEFYVAAGEKKSRVRLARTGKPVGTVVNYLHPDDEAYSFSGRYLCSPSLARLPDGALLASMDLFEGTSPQNLTLVYRSDDEGATWKHVSELMPCFWGKLLVYRGKLYMLACSTEYGDLLISRSDDGGVTFGAPVALLRGSNGKHGQSGCHKNPQNMICFGGRLWGTLEWGSWYNNDYKHAAMVMSCPEDADLLDPESWTFSEPRVFEPFAPELEGLARGTMTIEGTLTVDPEGRLVNVMRFGGDREAIVYAVNTEDPASMLEYQRCMPFEANRSKFTIRYDEKSGKYYTLACRIYDPEKQGARNLLSLMTSDDLKSWRVAADVIDRRETDHTKEGFQYVYFLFDGDDIIFLCRTATNGAHSFHDSNQITFHRIKDFRKL